MRVAFVHSYYRGDVPSGENVVVDAECDALRAQGVQVELFAIRTDDVRSDTFASARAGVRVLTGRGRSPHADIAKFQPDIVHVHNLFPNYARRWVSHVGVPIVHTLHNYRPLCANAHLYRDGSLCTLCPDGARLSGLRFGCYRNSRLATLPLTIANLGGPQRDPLLASAARLLVLSPLEHDLYRRSGVPQSRLFLAPNFVPESLDPGVSTEEGEVFVAAGRLTAEKGFARLARDWPEEFRLLIVGNGPDQRAIEASGNPSIQTLGRMHRPALMELMRTARAVVFPSLWPETFGLTAIEAMACGTPVVALEGNGAASMVSAYGGGVVTSWEELTSALKSVPADRAARMEARTVFESHFSENEFVERRLRMYQELMIASTRSG